ncbi:hypothetical protein S7335_978 [Synechococcus sp. PCC 7335]|uniref:hypothetical protein n=1 Tax=Synechococcus sp. (strain ATCC 29403 / PCC 7335) TaxID=91464 RepID=UPI00017EC82A|nr:hypothetical protein [Synechococcus sp. PCC 7335]EDX82677.1 hypothetical protein S7335_978 [Synechococcus sp. PCC 7335]
MTQSLYSRTQVEEWQSNLVKIAEQPRMTFTKKEAIEEIIDTIEIALAKRSYREVASGLKEWGLDISESSLRKYVSQYRRRHQPEPTVTTVTHKRDTKTKKKASSKRSKLNNYSTVEAKAQTTVPEQPSPSTRLSEDETAGSNFSAVVAEPETTVPAPASPTAAKQSLPSTRLGEGKANGNDSSSVVATPEPVVSESVPPSTRLSEGEPTVNNRPPTEATLETTVSIPTTPSKRLGKGRLISDDSSGRYPAGQGEPLSINEDL